MSDEDRCTRAAANAVRWDAIRRAEADAEGHAIQRGDMAAYIKHSTRAVKAQRYFQRWNAQATSVTRSAHEKRLRDGIRFVCTDGTRLDYYGRRVDWHKSTFSANTTRSLAMRTPRKREHRPSARRQRSASSSSSSRSSDPPSSDEPPSSAESPAAGRVADSDTPHVTIPPGWTPVQVVWHVARLLLDDCAEKHWHLAALHERRADHLAFGNSDRSAA